MEYKQFKDLGIGQFFWVRNRKYIKSSEVYAVSLDQGGLLKGMPPNYLCLTDGSFAKWYS